jgi:S-DNA-T family DNA segregation ATPase FtsK/SpoIIIE
MGLLREGDSVGLHVLISGDRSLLLGRIGALVEHKLLLRLPDRNDYALAGIAVRDVPEQLPPGRGVWADSAVETQIAVLSDDLTGTGQATAVHAIAEAARLRDDSTASPLRPFRLADLPTHVPAEPLLDALQPVDATAGVDRPEGPRPGERHHGRAFPTRSRLWVPLGIGGDDSDLLGLDLSASPVAVIAGPPRSGRTAALRFVQAAAARREVRTLAVCRCGGALADQTRRVHGPAAVFTGSGSDPGQSEQTLIGQLRELPPQSLILIDDAEMIRDGDLAPALLAVTRQAREKTWGVVVTGDTTHLATGLSGWLFEARRARQGLLLAPRNLADGEVVGVRLVPSQLVTRNLPGRGLLVGATEQPTAVQVPLVQEPDPGRG